MFLKSLQPKLKKIQQLANNSYLCLKYPFLYPRNRFDGKYHHYTLSNLVYTLRSKSTLDCRIHIHHVKKDENTINKNLKPFNNPEFKISHQGTLITVTYKNQTFTYDYSKDLQDKFTIVDFKVVRPWYHDSSFIIALYVIKNEEDKYTYGFACKKFTFIVDSLSYKLANLVEWFDTHILDKILIIPEHTELDALDKGWRKAFGLKICEEIKQSLLKTGGRKALNNYRITQIKEKFGSLRWYDMNSTKEIFNIINKYEDISYRTCIVCGKQAKYRSKGWICPYCEEHIEDKDNAELINYDS